MGGQLVLFQQWGTLIFILFCFQAHHVMSQSGGPGRARPRPEGGARVDGQFRNGILPVAAGGVDQAPGQPDHLPGTRAGEKSSWMSWFQGLQFELEDALE